MDRVVGADDRGMTGAQVSHPEPPDVARDDPSRPEHDRRMVRSVLAGGCLALALVGVSAGPALAGLNPSVEGAVLVSLLSLCA